MVFTYLNKLMHYQDEGSGPVLVLLHGYPESHLIWQGFSESIKTHFRIISPDLPGLGDSEQIAEIQSMEMMAACVKELLDSLKITECVMIGHSMGGYVTLAFAELFPEMLKGFGLFHSMALEDTEEGKTNRDRTIELIRRNKNNFLNQFIPNLFAEHNRERFGIEIAKLQETGRKASTSSLIALMEGMKIRRNRTDILENSKVPVLFILGKHDSRMPVEKIQPQTSLPTIAQTLILGNAGHMGFYEEKDVTLRVVTDFTGLCYSLSLANHSA